MLCDMSSLNANTFFELGIRTAVDKAVALVGDQHTPKIPFDTSLINYHTYDGSLTPWTIESEIQKISDHLLKAVNTSNGRNTLWRYFGLTTRGQVPAPATVEDKLNMILEAVLNRSELSDGSPETQLIDIAQTMARTTNAEFQVTLVRPGHVVLDSGNFIIRKQIMADLLSMAKMRGIALIIASTK